MMRSPLLLFLPAFFLLSIESAAQTKLKAYFQNDTTRLNSTSAKMVDTAVYIVVPKGQSLPKGKVVIAVNKNTSSADLQAIRVPVTNEFKIGALEDTMRIRYPVTVPRDASDDRSVGLEIRAYDSLNKRVALADGDTTAIVYIKPLVADSLTTNDTWEFWLFTGTNFDPFAGAKAQEFFFRANTVFKIAPQFYGQIGFYKNRYFTADSTTKIPILYPNSPNRIINGTDTSYSYTEGSYQRNISQKIDPVGVQLDLFYKLSKENMKGNSSFFATGGMDISTKQFFLENKFTNLDTATVLRPRPIDRGLSPPPLNDQRVSFQLPVYNFNVGLLWILDNNDINIKAHVAGGASFFQGAVISTPRGSNQPVVTYDSTKVKPYTQIRMFATAKKPGISFGFELYARSGLFPQFNYTLSKVFDLRNFLNILTPVSALRLKPE
jgi:hypothetical protein